MFLGYLQIRNTHQKQLIKVSLLAQSTLHLIRRFGVSELLLSINFSCGWLHTVDVGRQTDWHVKASHIMKDVFYVTKGKRILTIFFSLVSSQEIFGSRFSGFMFMSAPLAPKPKNNSWFCCWAQAEQRIVGLTRK